MKSPSRTLAVTFVEFPATVDGRLLGPQSRDVYSLFRLPARSADLLAAIAKRAGFHDTVAMTPALRKRGRLSEEDWQRLRESDIVGISVITRTAPPSYEAARLIREANPRATIIFGGPHASALPEEALRYGDIVVMREGDHTLVELLERLEESRAHPRLADVKGIAYKEGGEVVVTPPRPFLTNAELDALPFPVFPPYVLKRITHQTVCTSRGCPFGCEYCSVIQSFGRGYRYVSEDRTMEFLRHHLAQSRAPIFFADDNFTANRGHTKSLLERCLSEGLRLPAWSCQSRVEAAFDDELLDLMVKTDFSTVMVGFESVNNETLKLWHKSSSLEKNIEAVQRFHAKGIVIHGMFVLGSDADTVETIDQTIAFAKRMKLDTAQFFAITPIPGPPLTRKLEEQGCILTRDWHLYDAQHVVVKPARMTAMELQQGIMRAFREFYSPWEGVKRLFARAPQRLQNCVIRFLGRRLVRRIEKETTPHRNGLERLNEWIVSADALYGSYKERLKELGAKIEASRADLSRRLETSRADLSKKLEASRADLSKAMERGRAELAERKARVIAGFEEHVAALRASLTSLAEGYHPFCQRLLDELHARFTSEAEAVLVSV